MQIDNIGLSALKGGRHTLRASVQLDLNGAAGDRKFAVVDLDAGRVLRTVEHPLLVRCAAHFGDGTLSVDVAGRTWAGTPTPTGEIRVLEYWEREIAMQVVDGPWAPALGHLLGQNVALAQISEPGGVVYGGAVTLVTTSSLQRLANDEGSAIDPRRFRATFTIDTGDAQAYVEDTWAERQIDLGGARLLVGAGIPRCAVIDGDPDTGARGTSLLKTLARSRLNGQDIPFGVYARVVRPGLVCRGDSVTLSA